MSSQIGRHVATMILSLMKGQMQGFEDVASAPGTVTIHMGQRLTVLPCDR